MGSLELRDHAQQILEAVALDLSAPQSPEEQADKSKGLAPAPARETAAQTHAVMRARSGYDIKQLASEYRALRASLLSLWMDECLPAAPHLQDVIRFNEAKRGTTKERDRGLGLGLYIVREIAKGHGGDVEARSDDRETVFTVRLPRRSH